MSEPLLRVSNLGVGYRNGASIVTAVDGVSFDLDRGEMLGLVGESGSGKSTLVRGMLRILPPPGVITSGEVLLDGHDVLALDEPALRAIRWTVAAIVPQSALSALNPVLTVGAQIADTLRAHRTVDASALARRQAELLALVDLEPRHLGSYPHELSGGQRQRVAIALALALDPALVVLDEPTTALDVVVERQILRRVLELQRAGGFAILFITHDLALLRECATRIGVLYAGRLVELAPVEVFRQGALHPYASGLIDAIPPAVGEDREPISIPGSPPSLADPPPGCRFHPRCALADAQCRAETPALTTRGPDHLVACWHR